MKRLIIKIIKKLELIARGAQPSMAKFIQSNDIPVIRSDIVANEWQGFKDKIVQEFEKHPSDFLRQKTISMTVHPNQQNIAKKYLDELKNNKFITKEIMPTLHDLPIGNPYVCEFFPLVSPQSIQHIYYFFLIKKYLGVFVADSEVCYVLELGGGYGNFCRLVYHYGYKGKYTIIDFSEMHSIQQHFLSYTSAHNKVLFKAINNKNLSIQPAQGKSLFMATFSLNEMTIKDRQQVEGVLIQFDLIFIGYNKEIFSVNNVEYFEALAGRLVDQFDIQIVKDKHRQAWFLFGKKIKIK